ncbi:hypothetical protein [Cytophaga hutchinsonii]|jgi:hypothetical protein|uniref:Phosphoribosylpyrophosphate synthetase n=1 Tax=Cytophaga hutchinsonii (strain ATCC 33406 / DSM 1761 / CIP 103989 / NBRC 15051 / NCIMB 9469 / D465) TaxID=269798 RepID=A0A6N4SUK6_CYTH3|nr:hypothetical protein [Cytophaga hutchinsonii]ABG60147.1 hypothetical protein CHU_2902 [Cytophaga hutchinsonii ATCC 33406]SFX23167.1 hypothetical protein SAMN04487930_102155 [Cytophaga hutchinsonii ATCC 33406]
MVQPIIDSAEMKTLSACTKMLEEQGFKTQFLALREGIKSLASDRVYTPAQVKIVSFYRFEGNSDPEDNAILYSLETVSGERGLLIDAYGAEGDINITNFIVAVEDIHKKEHTVSTI